MEDLESLNREPEFREFMTYEMDQKIIHNTELDEATKKGKEEGKKESMLTVAKNMLKEGIDINIIIKCTNLTKEEIKNLSI